MNKWILDNCYDTRNENEAYDLHDAISEFEAQGWETKIVEDSEKKLLYYREKMNTCINCGKKISDENEICSECFVARTRGEL